jgi:RND family efflux transporter MFP subunit
VADAELTRAQASLREAQSRQGYARVTADWPKGADTRVVAARHADEGTTIAANEPILTIVDLAAVVVVVYATEEDYALLQADQRVALTTDAFPDEVFEGRVDRIAPVFAERSRQARVELRVPNEDGRLKPGMFVRAATSMSEVAAATVIPADALIEREGRPVVFVVSPDGATVRLHEVTVRARSGGFVAIDGEPIEGRVVTLGQQMLHDGAPIVIPNGTPTDETAP